MTYREATRRLRALGCQELPRRTGGQIRLLSLPELKKSGFEVLVRELGAANALRFFHLHETSRGDYTRDHEAWLSGLTIEQIEDEIRLMKARGEI